MSEHTRAMEPKITLPFHATTQRGIWQRGLLSGYHLQQAGMADLEIADTEKLPATRQETTRCMRGWIQIWKGKKERK